MSRIVTLRSDHAPEVAALHLAYLPTPFSDLPGVRLLAAYYRAVSVGQGAVGYIAEEADGVVGYVCGVWDGRALRRQLVRCAWPELLGWGALQVAIRPALLAGMVARLRPTSGSGDGAGYELRPIVVAPRARGSGVAAALLDRLLADAARRGFGTLYLFAAAANGRANAFYRNHGFVPTGSRETAGRHDLRYERATGTR